MRIVVAETPCNVVRFMILSQGVICVKVVEIFGKNDDCGGIGMSLKIELKNLGILKHAEFSLGDLTLICGENNTGKTYAAYALYGFLNSWRGLIRFPVSETQIQRLLTKMVLKIGFGRYVEMADRLLAEACDGIPINWTPFLRHLREGFVTANFTSKQVPLIIYLIRNMKERNGTSIKLPAFHYSKRKGE